MKTLAEKPRFRPRQRRCGVKSAKVGLAHISQPRMTQIMNLLRLAPDIQEELLHLPPIAKGKDPVTERDLRAITRMRDWQRQRAMWAHRA